MRLRQTLRERIRWCKSDTLPGQTLKRKKWIFALIVLMCATFDVLILFILGKAISPLLDAAPYLPKEHAQAYTHVTTLRDEARPRLRDDIHAIAFSPDGQTLAAGGHRKILIWDVSSGALITTLKVDKGWMNAVAIAFSPDGKTVASVNGKRGRICHPPVILLDPLASRHLVRHTIQLWDIKTGTTRLTFPVNTLPITALEFSSDGTKLLIVSEQGFIDVYDNTTGHREKFSRSPFVHDAIRNTYQFSALAFSSDGKIFATGGRDSDDRGLYDIADAEIQLWDTDTGHLLHTFNSPGRWVNWLVFSPDGKTLASVYDDGDWRNMIFIWDVENCRLLTTINVNDVGEWGVLTLKFAPDSITLASGHINGTVHIWDITGRTKSEQIKEE